MSQAGGPSSGGGFGEARIDFTGNTAPLEAAAAKAVDVTKGAANQAQAAATANADAVSKVAAETDNANVKMTRFLGSVARISAVATTFYALGSAIRSVVIELSKSGEDRAKEFMDTITSPLAAERIKRTEEEIGKLASNLDKLRSSFGNRVLNLVQGVTEGDLRGQINELTKSIAEDRKFVEAQRIKAIEDLEKQAAKRAEEAEQARVEALKERVRKETAATLEGIDRIKFEEESRIAEINKLREKASDQEKRQLDEIKRLIGVQTQREIDEFKRKEAEKRQEAAATALAIERAFSRALGQVQQQSASLFTGDQVTAQLERVASLLEQIADQRSTIGGRD